MNRVIVNSIQELVIDVLDFTAWTKVRDGVTYSDAEDGFVVMMIMMMMMMMRRTMMIIMM